MMKRKAKNFSPQDMREGIEFAHNLSAVIDGHKIEAGYDEDSYSYIIFDGKRIAEKRRII